jgi:ABC-type nitrate/sulfonate/bicarbonate transport system substrate-binding protein
MEANGGDPKSVKVFEVPYSVIVPAIEQGRIDAGTLIQPQLGLALRDAKVRGFAKTYDAISTHFYITCWLTTSSFASANPDAVRRFAGVMREAEIYCNAHKADTAEMLANFSAIDLDTVKGGGRDVYGASYLDVNNLQPVIDACVRYKVIDKRFDATDLISAAVRGLH